MLVVDAMAVAETLVLVQLQDALAQELLFLHTLLDLSIKVAAK